ncbi:MAG: hypothetical protein IBJ11_02960 [Phycisphaerales bacterium]|nr:hypothetical protein [Phycisphaerales bacterium]
MTALAIGSPVSGVASFGAVAAGTARAARRVAVLCIIMAILGLADLVMTVTYMKTTGMFEVNPIARYMVDVGQSRQLILFKLFTIALSSGGLFLVRRHRLAEVAAWSGTALLVALTAHWIHYNQHAPEMTAEWVAIAMGPTPPGFVSLGE